jgi:hypothetical protein
MVKVRGGNKNAQKGDDPLGHRVVTFLDDRQLAKLDAYADRHGLKRSAALRRLVEELDGLE